MCTAQLTWDFSGGWSTLLCLRLRYWLGEGFLGTESAGVGTESAGAVTSPTLVNRES